MKLPIYYYSETLSSLKDSRLTVNMESSVTSFAPMNDSSLDRSGNESNANGTNGTLELSSLTTTIQQESTQIEGMEALDSNGFDEIKNALTAEELSFYSANIWGLLSGVGGNIYEW